MLKTWKIATLTLILIVSICAVIFYPQYQKFLPAKIDTAQALSQQDIQNIRQNTPITQIYVIKSKRIIYLKHKNQTIRAYPMRLGFNPIGHKTEEGDGKTPEGTYSIDWRNPNSVFYKSLHISYPNAADTAQATARGVSAGGDIMIHGSADSKTAQLPKMMTYMPQKDWTWGCIAVRNVDMDEIWQLVNNDVMIQINP